MSFPSSHFSLSTLEIYHCFEYVTLLKTQNEVNYSSLQPSTNSEPDEKIIQSALDKESRLISFLSRFRGSITFMIEDYLKRQNFQ